MAFSVQKPLEMTVDCKIFVYRVLCYLYNCIFVYFDVFEILLFRFPASLEIMG